MKTTSILLTLILLLLSNAAVAQQEPETVSKAALTIGERVEFRSEVLAEKRVLNIYLPNSYSKDVSKTYPVIYLLDGSIDEDFIHVSGLVQFGSFSWINMLPESIVVGIANIDRRRDFTYPTTNTKDKKDFPTTGGSANFITFIENEVQAFIEKHYRTTAVKTLIGQSLGGLLATEILFKKPELFDHYIIVSPSLWWDDESLLRYKPASYTTEKSICIAVGKEGAVMERTARALYEKLQKLKAANTALYFDFLDDRSHGDALHLAVYHAFEKIFSAKKE